MPYEPDATTAHDMSPFAHRLAERFLDDYVPGLALEHGSYRVTADEIVVNAMTTLNGSTVHVIGRYW